MLTACAFPAPIALAGEALIFAAASLKEAMDEVATDFEQKTGHDITLSFAGSSVLARQIAAGAPADIFISANAAWMDVLHEARRIDPATRIDLLSNELVLIAHDPDAAPVDLASGDLRERLEGNRLAMALVDAVPAGIYGKAALLDLGLWDKLAPRVVQTDNVRAALALVARGETAFGIVYASDALAEPSVSIVARFQPGSHPPIRYPAAAMAESGNKLNGPLLDYMQGAEARSIFARHGFTLIDTPR